MKVAIKKETPNKNDSEHKVSLSFENKSFSLKAIYKNYKKRIIVNRLNNLPTAISQLKTSQILLKSDITTMYYSIMNSEERYTKEEYCSNCCLLKEIHKGVTQKCPNQDSYFKLTINLPFEFKQIINNTTNK